MPERLRLNLEITGAGESADALRELMAPLLDVLRDIGTAACDAGMHAVLTVVEDAVLTVEDGEQVQ